MCTSATFVSPSTSTRATATTAASHGHRARSSNNNSSSNNNNHNKIKGDFQSVHLFALSAKPRDPGDEERRCRTQRIDEEHVPATTSKPSPSSSSSSLSSSLSFSLDPTSEAAHQLVTQDLGLGETQYEQLVQLASLVVEWNDRVNLVSRPDCNAATVFGRHILPSVAVCALSSPDLNPLHTARSVVDVGTGGGFPGLPLAIAYPQVQFVLLDAVGKKLTAVQDMASRLGFDSNRVMVHHGRAELYFQDQNQRQAPFDVAMGRSVAALPEFCGYMRHLIHPAKGHLMYWIGGVLAPHILSCARSDIALSSLIRNNEFAASNEDKRILIFPVAGVRNLSGRSERTVRVVKPQSSLASSSSSSASPSSRQQQQQQQEVSVPQSFSQRRRTSATNTRPSSSELPNSSLRGRSATRSASASTPSRSTKARGSWAARDGPKQRGYESFVRYSSQGGFNSNIKNNNNNNASNNDNASNNVPTDGGHTSNSSKSIGPTSDSQNKTL